MGYLVCQETYSWEGTKMFKMYYVVIYQIFLYIYIF